MKKWINHIQWPQRTQCCKIQSPCAAMGIFSEHTLPPFSFTTFFLCAFDLPLAAVYKLSHPNQATEALYFSKPNILK